MAARVLVTRPEPGASATAKRLKAAGMEPVLLPLTRIEALAASFPDGADGHDAVALTSANAVRLAPPGFLASIAHLPCHAVGEATAEAARRAGLNVVAADAGDAQGLAAGLIAALPRGARVLYPCGRVRTKGFDDELARAGIDVTAIEIYDAVACDPSSDEIARQVGAAPLSAALVHSRRGGELLADIMSRPELRSIFEGTVVIGISAKALEPLRDRPVAVASAPSEPALIETVKAKV